MAGEKERTNFIQDKKGSSPFAKSGELPESIHDWI
jgi:hypothetical protein